MNPQPPPLEIHTLATAPWYVLAHLALALTALAIGTSVLLRRKGDRLHKAMGWAWVCLMLCAALTSFLIHARGRFSLIHVLSVVILVTVPLGVMHIRNKRVRSHRFTMISAFAGLVIAGAFTLLPYRMLGRLLFGSS